MEVPSSGIRPWWRFWKTKTEKQQMIADSGYYWAQLQILKGKSAEAVRKRSTHTNDPGIDKLIKVGIEEAIKDFQ